MTMHRAVLRAVKVYKATCNQAQSFQSSWIFVAFQYHALLLGLSAVTSPVVREPAAPPSPNVLETRKPENHAC